MFESGVDTGIPGPRVGCLALIFFGTLLIAGAILTDVIGYISSAVAFLVGCVVAHRGPALVRRAAMWSTVFSGALLVLFLSERNGRPLSEIVNVNEVAKMLIYGPVFCAVAFSVGALLAGLGAKLMNARH